MSDQISSENEQFIQQEIAAGTFRSRDEVINAGVELLKQRQDLVNRLRDSRRQLDSGEFEEFDRAGLQELFDNLKRRARV